MKKHLGVLKRILWLGFLTAATLPLCQAKTVHVIIEGTTAANFEDFNGNTFGTNSLGGYPFTLNLYFNDALGTPGQYTCGTPPTAWHTWLSDTNANPAGATGTLEINDHTFYFDVSHGAGLITSLVDRFPDNTFTTCSSGYSGGALNYYLETSDYGSFGTASVGWSGHDTAGLLPATTSNGDPDCDLTGTFGGSPDWEQSMGGTDCTDPNHYLPVYIYFSNDGTTIYDAGGSLDPTAVQIY